MDNKVEELFAQIKAEPDVLRKSHLIYKLRKEEDVPLQDIAHALNLKPSYLSHILRLRRLPELIVDGYYSDLISLSHLFVLSRLKNAESMVALYEKVLAENLSSLQTEFLVREHLHGVKTDGEYLPAMEKEKYVFEGHKHNTKVKVDLKQSRIKTTLTVELKGSVKDANSLIRNLLPKIRDWRHEEGM